ncbi:flagellin [Bacillus sp. JJ1609]|uniref:flagellin N-terminal helical domain-containing protein n=1 Tax=Bacillus sp. JJ1609 TaxID=3122977 RepID=UPI002FFE7348
MRINHNIAALNTHRQLSNASGAQAKSMEKLASGLRINKAGDDAAGLAISEKMRGQIRGLDMAAKNSQDAISMIQTAEGALNETHDILQRMRELAVQSSNDTNTNTDRTRLQEEVDELAKEITRISNNTEFNTQKLIDGTKDSTAVAPATIGTALTFHIGANASQNITLDIKAMDATTLGVAGAGATNAAASIAGGDAVTVDGISVSTQTAADTAITSIQTAIDTVSAERSKLGAYSNRLEHTINNLNTSSENLTAAESRIRDVDYALAA